MNKNIYIGLFAFAICLFVSCKKQSLLTYDVSDNIYFNYKAGGIITDSTNISFATRVSSVKDSIFKLPVAITGTPKDHDRTYRVMVVDSNTTAVIGTHFILPATFTFRAGRVIDSLPIKLLRTADLQSKVIALKLALTPGNDFITDIKTMFSSIGGEVNILAFKLKVSDILTQGTSWTSAFAPYFGTFSVKKIRLINQITGMPLDYPATYAFDLQSIAKRTVYAITMSQYLREQKAAGNTVYEDDGITEMKMAVAYQ